MASRARPSPDDLLRQIEAEERKLSRGRLKVFLGYASGVGKSFRMLDEGRRRKERGQDVIVGALQPKSAPGVEGLLQALEIIPLAADGAMNLDAILRRRPGVCLVDGLAYDNPPGSLHAHRWQEVQRLLEAGVEVITSINIQYISELSGHVESITGKHVTQTVPQAFLFTTDEISVVDAPAGAANNRAAPSEGETARRLSQLRELALLFAADVVDHQLEEYLRASGINAPFGTQERIMVCITPRANAKAMIQSGRGNADRFHGDLIVAYVRQPELSPADSAALERNLALAREMDAEVQILDGDDPIEAILSFARERGVTQIFIGHSLQERWWHRWTGGRVDRLIQGAKGMDVRVFPH
jgi:two-component system sensor histidine kinase KdpD